MASKSATGLPKIYNIDPSEQLINGNISSDGRKEEKEEKAGQKIELKDFFWDQFLLYIGSAIALLTILDLSLQFFRSPSGLQCLLPTQFMSLETTRDQAAYVNAYCLDSLTQNEYYSIFILLQGIVITTPHFIWEAIFVGQFDFFLNLVKQIDRLRDSSTGEYRPINFDIVRKLENEFPEKWKFRGIFMLYIVKIIIQLIIIVASVFINALVFEASNFAFIFECPHNFNRSNLPIPGWSYPFPISCTYPPFRLLSKIQVADYILLVFAFLAASYGLIWCFKRHTSSLGYRDIARFSFASSLPPEEYVFEWYQFFTPRIKNDLDFLLMRLFRADSGHGRVFRDIQIDKELNRLFGKYKERLLLFRTIQADDIRRGAWKRWIAVKEGIELNSESRPRIKDIQDLYLPMKSRPDEKVIEILNETTGNDLTTEESAIRGIKDHIYYFFTLCKNYENGITLAYDLSFGTIGYGVQLAFASKKVVSVNFHPHFRKNAATVKFQSNSVITLQEDIYSQDSGSVKESYELIHEEMKRTIGSTVKDFYTVDLMVIGPFVDEIKKTTVSFHLERMNNAYFDDGAILLVIQPLKIGRKDVSKYFCQYIPPKGIFEEDKENSKELKFECDQTKCSFKFTVYKYAGKHHRPEVNYLHNSEESHLSVV